ncbi:MAG: type II toxin-antitoxin system RelE/ParE family toxin, partial [bacterium]
MRIRKAIEQRLATDPVKYGEPLRRSLQGYRKLRVGDYRVIYKDCLGFLVVRVILLMTILIQSFVMNMAFSKMVQEIM